MQLHEIYGLTCNVICLEIYCILIERDYSQLNNIKEAKRKHIGCNDKRLQIVLIENML
jgi:hypothetical protein